MRKGFWIITQEVIKKSDVVIEVLDARMPHLTRIPKLEKFAIKFGKKLIVVINKIDIVSKTSIKNLRQLYDQKNTFLISTKMGTGLKKLVQTLIGLKKNRKT